MEAQTEGENNCKRNSCIFDAALWKVSKKAARKIKYGGERVGKSMAPPNLGLSKAVALNWIFIRRQTSRRRSHFAVCANFSVSSAPIIAYTFWLRWGSCVCVYMYLKIGSLCKLLGACVHRCARLYISQAARSSFVNVCKREIDSLPGLIAPITEKAFGFVLLFSEKARLFVWKIHSIFFPKHLRAVVKMLKIRWILMRIPRSVKYLYIWRHNFEYDPELFCLFISSYMKLANKLF